jgi:hypothetical protein
VVEKVKERLFCICRQAVYILHDDGGCGGRRRQA